MNKRTTIIIVTWNSEDEIGACLNSLINDVKSAEANVIIVDNASTDGTGKLIRNEFPWCELIINPTNTGFAAANNIGIRRAKSKFIMLLNPDTELYQNALPEMVKFLDMYPDIGVVGPKVYMKDDVVQPTILPYPSVIGTFFGFMRYLLHSSSALRTPNVNTGDHLLVDAVSGACMLIRRKALDQVGIMDKEYFLCAEEVDLCYRIKSSGWAIAYYAGAEIFHYRGRSMAKASLRSFVERRRGRVLFMLRHRSEFEARLEMHLIELFTWIRSILKPADRQYYRDALALFKKRTYPLFESDNK